MTLNAYRALRGLTIRELAAELGKPFSTVAHWCGGNRRPDWADIPNIERVTNGAVTANDFVPREGACANAD